MAWEPRATIKQPPLGNPNPLKLNREDLIYWRLKRNYMFVRYAAKYYLSNPLGGKIKGQTPVTCGVVAKIPYTSKNPFRTINYNHLIFALNELYSMPYPNAPEAEKDLYRKKLKSS